MKRPLFFSLALLLLASCEGNKHDTLVLYTTRQPFLLQGLIDSFTSAHGIKVDVVYAKSGLLERLQIEGELTPADVVYAADYGDLVLMAEQGLLKAVANSEPLAALPPRYRPDKMWFAVTKRVRALFTSRERTAGLTLATYDSMTQAPLRGRVCMRSGLHPYNVGLFATMAWHRGMTWTQDWLRRLKESLARRPQGNDRSQARAIYQGVCDVTIMNSYYLGKMLASGEQEQRDWAESLSMIFPDEAAPNKGKGAYVSLSAVGMVRWTDKENEARTFMEFLLSPDAQRWFMEENMEYPIDAGLGLSPLLESWGRWTEMPLDFVAIARLRPALARMVDALKFDTEFDR